MRQEQVSAVMNDPLAQELLGSAIPARMAYNGTDGYPRAIPIGFFWKDGRIVMCTASNAYKVKALAANPKVALTIDTDTSAVPRAAGARYGGRGDSRRRAARVPGCIQEGPERRGAVSGVRGGGAQVALLLAYWREMALYYERHRDERA